MFSTNRSKIGSGYCPYMASGYEAETGEPALICMANFLQVGQQFESGRCQMCPAASGEESEISQRAAFYREHGSFPEDPQPVSLELLVLIKVVRIAAHWKGEFFTAKLTNAAKRLAAKEGYFGEVEVYQSGDYWYARSALPTGERELYPGRNWGTTPVYTDLGSLGLSGVYARFEIVEGFSGTYCIGYDHQGNVVRDDRPWQMKI